MQIPTCAQCGSEHYRFVRCADVSAWNAKHAEKQARQANPRIQNRSTPAGMHEVTVGRIDNLRIQKRSVPKGYHVQRVPYWQGGPPDEAA